MLFEMYVEGNALGPRFRLDVYEEDYLNHFRAIALARIAEWFAGQIPDAGDIVVEVWRANSDDEDPCAEIILNVRGSYNYAN